MTTIRSALGLVFLALLLTPDPGFAQDGHIDPAANAGIHNLTFARHVSTTFTTTNATQALAHGTGLLTRCDSRVDTDQDVACQVTMAVSGTVGTFGMAGDGLDVIDVFAERATVSGNTTAYVKVVSAITVGSNGMPATVLGFAPCPGSSLVLDAGNSTSTTGLTLVHEFGHNKGLVACPTTAHRSSPGVPIMLNALTPGMDEVNLAECAAYHMGATNNGPNRPVDVAFIIDDTGSMWEEIGGVRTALTNHLATYSPDDCNAFQLTTFKDGVTERSPTTDLAAIQSQVAGLVASGGGDCPEASVEAINQVREKVKDGARAFLATDAGPHPGLDISAAIAALRARGIRVDVVLTGTCTGGLTTEPSISWNDDGGGALDTALETVGAIGAIEAFSSIAYETGGLFAYVPEVNSGNPNDRTRFENVIFNVVQGGLTEAVSLVSPSRLYRGTAVTVELSGSSTNFTSDSEVEVDGDGVIVHGVTAVSPVKLIAELEIDSGAALGFRDIIATTPLGGETEVARGVGAVEIITAPGIPAIIGVAPASATRGQTLEILVSGVNTSFGPGSVLNLGPGVDVLSTTAESSSQLRATISVSGSASIGFRNLSVTTGPEVATNLGVRLFLVASAAVPVPRVLSVTPNELGPGVATEILIRTENTTLQEGVTLLSFGGGGIDVLSSEVLSATEMRAEVLVAPGTPSGFRDVIVETGAEIAVGLGALFITANSPPVCDGAYPSVDLLWPPNHKMNAISIEGVVDPEGQPVTIVINGISQDEPVDSTGDGSFAPDGGGVGTSIASLRAERQSPGNGRVYEITFTATDDAGASCTGTVTICVPPNKSDPSCVDDGQLYDSTESGGTRSPNALGVVSLSGTGAFFRLDLPEAGQASLRAFDVTGRLVKTLVDSHLAAGKTQVTWGGRDNDGRRVAPGVYFVRLKVNDLNVTQRVVIVR